MVGVGRLVEEGAHRASRDGGLWGTRRLDTLQKSASATQTPSATSGAAACLCHGCVAPSSRWGYAAAYETGDTGNKFIGGTDRPRGFFASGWVNVAEEGWEEDATGRDFAIWFFQYVSPQPEPEPEPEP